MPRSIEPGAPERRSGTMGVASGAGLSDHACWGYRSPTERADVASAWLTDGLALGQRALCIGDGPMEDLVAELATVPDRDAALATGALVVSRVSDVYDLGAPIDAGEQLARYDAMLEQALADGFTGICAAVDITPLVQDVDRRRAHARWEQIGDRYVAEHPLAPLCLYDADAVGALDAIVCVHPLQGPERASFSLHARSATTAAIEGVLDAFAADVLATVLATSPRTDDVLVADGVGFVDARAAWVLHDHLRRRRGDGQAVAVVGAPERLRRVWDVCGFDPTLISA
jgi:hypothetical protein